MEIRLHKEKKDMYFAELMQGKEIYAYAQGETPQKAILNLGDVYEMRLAYEAERATEKKKTVFSLDAKYMDRLDTLRFSSLTLKI